MGYVKDNCLRTIAAPSISIKTQIESAPLLETPPLPQCEVCVVVPVRDEAEILEQTLAALSHQVDFNGDPLKSDRYEIILFANNCSDQSAAIAHCFAQQHPLLKLHIVEQTLPASQAYIGWVRQRLMDEAYRRLTSIGRHRGVIASTDGDTCVAPNWIAAILHEVSGGADAVGGRIITDRSDRSRLDHYTRACHLREVGYRFLIAELAAYLDPNPWDNFPRHFQHYGASLAVTAEAYARAGGLPPVKTSEDVALYQALMRVNARFRHSPLVRVTTSARQVGRAQGGLANQLSAWTAMGTQQQPILVEPAGAIVARLQARDQIKQLWHRFRSGYPLTHQEISLPASQLGINDAWLMHALAHQTSLGALFEQIEPQQMQEALWRQRWSLVRIEQAIDDLRLHLQPLRRKQAHLYRSQPLPNQAEVAERAPFTG